MENDITDADFAYLNASTANVKALKLEALNAVDLYNAAYQRFLDAEAVYTDAKRSMRQQSLNLRSHRQTMMRK